jgi:hypothetical protein
MTDQERREILRQAREHLARRPGLYTSPPVERREWRQPEPEPPEPEPKLDTAEIDWSGEIARAIANVRNELRADLEGTRAFILEVVGQGLGELLDGQRQDFEAKLAQVESKLAKLDSEQREARLETAELRIRLAEQRQARGNAALDLPPVARRELN